MDELEQALMSLRAARSSSPPPSAAKLAALARRDRRRRIELVSATLLLGVCGIVVAGAALGLNDSGSLDVSANGSNSSIRSRARSSGSNCGSYHAEISTPAPGIGGIDLAAVESALAERFPDTFGGLVNTGNQTVKIFAVDRSLAVENAAKGLLGRAYRVRVRPTVHSLRATRALKLRIEKERAELGRLGLAIAGVGIHIADPGGPKVLLGLTPNTSNNRTLLCRRYGSDRLIILPGSGQIILD